MGRLQNEIFLSLTRQEISAPLQFRNVIKLLLLTYSFVGPFALALNPCFMLALSLFVVDWNVFGRLFPSRASAHASARALCDSQVASTGFWQRLRDLRMQKVAFRTYPKKKRLLSDQNDSLDIPFNFQFSFNISNTSRTMQKEKRRVKP